MLAALPGRGWRSHPCVMPLPDAAHLVHGSPPWHSAEVLIGVLMPPCRWTCCRRSHSLRASCPRLTTSSRRASSEPRSQLAERAPCLTRLAATTLCSVDCSVHRCPMPGSTSVNGSCWVCPDSGWLVCPGPAPGNVTPAPPLALCGPGRAATWQLSVVFFGPGLHHRSFTTHFQLQG